VPGGQENPLEFSLPRSTFPHYSVMRREGRKAGPREWFLSGVVRGYKRVL